MSEGYNFKLLQPFRSWQRDYVLKQREELHYRAFDIIRSNKIPAAWQPKPVHPDAAIKAMRDFVNRGHVIKNKSFWRKPEFIFQDAMKALEESPILVVIVRTTMDAEDGLQKPTYLEISTPDITVVISAFHFENMMWTWQFLWSPSKIILTTYTATTLESLKSAKVFLLGVVDIRALEFFVKYPNGDPTHLDGIEREWTLSASLHYTKEKQDDTELSCLMQLASKEAAEVLAKWYTLVFTKPLPAFKTAVGKAMSYMAPLVASEIHLPKNNRSFPDFKEDYENMKLSCRYNVIVPPQDGYLRGRALWSLRSIVASQLNVRFHEVLETIEVFNTAKKGLDFSIPYSYMLSGFGVDYRESTRLAARQLCDVAYYGQEALANIRSQCCALCGQLGHFEAICKDRVLGVDDRSCLEEPFLDCEALQYIQFQEDAKNNNQ